MRTININPRMYIFLTVLVFLVPLRWVAAWMLAVAFHELCHLSAVKLCGGQVSTFSVGLGIANMECIALKDGAYLFATLAGPVGGLLLGLLGRWLPRVAICSWILSLYNLLPILPLDGGHALYLLFKDKHKFLVFEKTVLIILSLLAIYSALFMELGLLPIIVAGSLWARNRKRPCNATVCRVQ